MSVEDTCEAIRDDLTAGPFSPAEYRHLLNVRRGSAYPPAGPLYDQWKRHLCRFLTLFPQTLEREMWHEAGHAVVGHALGGQVRRIRRDHEGTPAVVFRRPDGWTGLDEATMTVAGWLCEAIQFDPALTDPTDEVAELVREWQTPTGEKLSLDERLKYVAIAENRARGILAANRAVVERIALRAITRLPIEKGELRRMLEGTRQQSN